MKTPSPFSFLFLYLFLINSRVNNNKACLPWRQPLFFYPTVFLFIFQDPTTTGYGIKKYGYRSKKLFENSYLGYVTSVPPTPHAYSDVPMFVLNKCVTGNSVPTCEPASRTRPVPEDNEAAMDLTPDPSLAQPGPSPCTNLCHRPCPSPSPCPGPARTITTTTILYTGSGKVPSPLFCFIPIYLL